MSLRTISAAIGAALLAGAGPAVVAAAPVTEVYTPLLGPVSITAAPDGALWVTNEPDPGGITRISTEGALSSFPAGGGFAANMQPTGIAVGPDGALWFAQGVGTAVQRYEIATKTFTTRAAPTGQVKDVAAGEHGSVWYTAQGAAGAIGRVDGAGAVHEFVAGVTPGLTANKLPQSIVRGPDDGMWFTEAAAPGRIGRISYSGQVTEFPLPDLGPAQARPHDIVAGPDGALWFTDPGTGTIGRMTTTGALTRFSAGLLAGAEPRGITAGPDGALWFTDSSRGSSSVGRISTDGAITTYSFGITPQSRPWSIATGPDDHLWFAEPQADRVGRLAAPPAVTVPAATPTVGGGTLAATVDPNGSFTTYRFEYGPTPAYGSETTELSAGRGRAPVEVSAALSGLGEGRTIHARLRAVSDAGETVSQDIAFTTAQSPPATTPPPPPGPPPVPVIGQKVVVAMVAGNVRVRNKGETNWWNLGAAEDIPLGSVVDASQGRVSLTSALDKSGRTQSGIFWDGYFTIGQKTSTKGLTDIRLWGGDFAQCGKRAKRSLATAAARKKKRKKTSVRRLWSRDSKGRFRTHGHDSVATVRGTEWFTEDRCDGTLTRVKSGSVVVKPRRGKSRVVKAGKSFLARRAR